DALRYYLRSITADPMSSLAWANYGKLAYKKGEWSSALKAADAAVDCPNPEPLALSLWIAVHHLTKTSEELARRAEELLTHPGAPGELVAEGHFLAHHIFNLDPQLLLRARDRVEQDIAANVQSSKRAFPSVRPEPRTLGFLSAAFKRHPVAFMTLGAVEHLR